MATSSTTTTTNQSTNSNTQMGNTATGIAPNFSNPSRGLNDDWLLDDQVEQKEEQIHIPAFKASAPGAIPEENPNVDLIAAAEEFTQRIEMDATAALEELSIAKRDLELLRGSIHADKGMTTKAALECNELIPGFIDDDVRPMGYFTTHPSKTMLKEALEAIDGEEKKENGKFSDKIKELVKKLIKWIGDLIEKAKSFFSKGTTDLKSELNVDPFDMQKFKKLALEYNPSKQGDDATARKEAEVAIIDFTKLSEKYHAKAKAALDPSAIAEVFLKDINARKAFSSGGTRSVIKNATRQVIMVASSRGLDKHIPDIIELLKDIKSGSPDDAYYESIKSRSEELLVSGENDDSEISKTSVVAFISANVRENVNDTVYKQYVEFVKLSKARIKELEHYHPNNPEDLKNNVMLLNIVGKMSGYANGFSMNIERVNKEVSTAISFILFELQKELSEELRDNGYEQRSMTIAAAIIKNIHPMPGSFKSKYMNVY